MSHGPIGLGGGTFRPAPACSAIVSVTPISVSARASISTRSILVFMFILFALPGLFRHLEFSRSHIRQAAAQHLAPRSGNVMQVNQSGKAMSRSEEHTSELQSLRHLVCRLL